MARAYGDDLRRKVAVGLRPGWGHTGRTRGTFCAGSVGWAKKISRSGVVSGQAERVPHHPGHRPRVGVETQKQVVAWVRGSNLDLTLAEWSARLHREASITLSRGRVWYLVRKLGLRLKKSRSTPPSATTKPTLKRREEFAAKIGAIAPEKMIFLDESGVTTSMTRLYARSLSGQRVHEATPGGHWKIMTILGAMSLRGMIATMTIKAATDRGDFPDLCRTGTLSGTQTG